MAKYKRGDGFYRRLERTLINKKLNLDVKIQVKKWQSQTSAI